MKFRTVRGIVPMLAVLCAGAGCVWAQSATENTQPNSISGNLPIMKIGPDDLLSIQVYDSPELTRSVRVSKNGTVSLPLLSEPVQAEGLYPVDLEREIAKDLKDQGVLVRPIVSVTVSEYRSRPVNVVGAVKRPTTFQVYQSSHLLDAITEAGGLSDDAGTEILVTHPGSNGKPGLVERIPVHQLINSADESLNIPLYGGEEVRVPEGGRVYIVGNVKKPGSIPVHDPNECTVIRVIAEAQGLEPYAANQAFILRHGDTPNNEIPIPLHKILERQAPDVPLMANDVLFIPDAKGKRVTARTLETIAAFGTGTLSGLLIWHR